MARSRKDPEPVREDLTAPERVVIVGVQHDSTPEETAERSLDELASLVETAGGEVVARVVQRRARPDPATYIGKGKAAELTEEVRRLEADTTVIDEELSPAQLRNLEEQISGKVIDRTILILDIFAQHAHSMEGKKQVELAQLTYGLPRLRGWGEALSRIGAGAAGGGGGRAPIGTRGPGETQLEIDRRRIERRINKLRSELDKLSEQRALRRKRREARVPIVSLVGYTNAGKSTLLNHLTEAGVLTEDKLFSTLDPTARSLRLPDGRKIVLMDTVGFIRKLPHQLVEAFQSTLEEVVGADVLVHVVDASRPDPDVDSSAVDDVLAEIGATDAPRILALNKVDLLAPEDQEALRRRFPDGIPISAMWGVGLDDLLGAVSTNLKSRLVEVEVLVPYEEGTLLSRLHDEARVVEEAHTAEGVRVQVRLRMKDLHAVEPYLVSGPDASPDGDGEL